MGAVVFKNLRIKFKLLLIVEMFAIIFLAFGWYAFRTIELTKVNGVAYQEIIKGKDLLAQLTPPTLFISESYLLAFQIAETTDSFELQELATEAENQRNDYLANHRQWFNAFPEGNLRRGLQGPVHDKAMMFYDIFVNRYIPAVLSHSSQAASDLLHNDLRVSFAAHRKQVNIIFELAEGNMTEMEQSALATIDERRMIFITLGVGTFLFAMFLVAFIITPAISRPLKEVEMAAKVISSGDLDCKVEYRSTDEFGSLTESFRETIKYLQEAALVADAMSQGDLRMPVKVRSDKDVLGQSLARMMKSSHDMISRIKQSVIQLMSTATEIAATSKQQEMTVNEFGASTNQVAAAVKEISATAQELSNTMNELTQVAGETTQFADAGRTDLTTLRGTMEQLADAAGSISKKLYTISEKANDINMVITTITKVADQTNLLSINAAIEAEKAGEYGVGFLVVSREIRRLADQTAVATLDIEQTVKQMQSAVSSGVMEMDKFTEMVRHDVQEVQGITTKTTKIIEGVQGVTDRFESINEGMRSQSLGAQQISQAMVSLSEGARTTSSSLKDFNRSTGHMHEAVKGLKEELSRFKMES
jgi:methyl-accepting chemotaxis protein WspA